MNLELIAQDIVKVVIQDAEENNTNAIDQWNDAADCYLLDGMPYDVRIGEGKAGRRNRKAEEKVSLIVERLLEQSGN